MAKNSGATIALITVLAITVFSMFVKDGKYFPGWMDLGQITGSAFWGYQQKQ